MSHLQAAKDYGTSQGWAIRTRHLRRKPAHWRDDWYAQADRVPITHTPRAEVAWVGEVDELWLATALFHEMGHCEQERLGQWEGSRWELECDAWERGLRMMGELGIPVTPAAAEQALACLLSYFKPGKCDYYGTVAEYLESVAYAEGDYAP